VCVVVCGRMTGRATGVSWLFPTLKLILKWEPVNLGCQPRVVAKDDFDYHEISEPRRLSVTLYYANLSGRCVFCSCWIAHEARSITASDICRAASRCESLGDEPVHAQPTFVSTLHVLPDLHLSTTISPA
jgi:hypothetical protein